MKIFQANQSMVSDVTSLVVLVLGIGILVLGVSLAYKNIVSNEGDIAKKDLQILTAKISALEDGQNTTFTIKGPEEWVILGWSKDEQGRPDRCFSYPESCLCICSERSRESCDSNEGFCGGISKDKIEVYNILSLQEAIESLGGPGAVSAVRDKAITRAFCISFPKTVAELSINKTSSSIIISDASEDGRC